MLLLLFGFSVTPKKILHDLLVHHTDSRGKLRAANDPVQVEKAWFSCHTEDLVVESPFTEGSPSIQVAAFSPIPPEHAEQIARLHSTTQFFFERRGPPSLL